MNTFEDLSEEISRLSLVPLENFLDGKASTFEKTAFSKVSGLVFKAASKYDQKLYESLIQRLETYYGRVIVNSLKSMDGEDLLREFVRYGENQETLGRFYNNQFEYLGRNYIKRVKTKSFQESAKILFQTIIYDDVKLKLSQTLLNNLHSYRDGAVVDKHLIKDTIHFVTSLGNRMLQCYEDDFERDFLADSRLYYREKCLQWLASDSVSVYLRKCDQILEREKALVSQFLHPMTNSKLQFELERELLMDKVVQLIDRENTGYRFMLEKNQVEEIRLFFKFVIRVGQGIDDMCRIFKEYLEEEGRRIWATRFAKEQTWSKENKIDLSDDSEMIISIFSLVERASIIVKVHCDNHVRFQEALRKGLEYIVNYQSISGKDYKKTFIELLAYFCDGLLKKDRKCDEKESEKFLEQAITILGFLQDKDMFRNEYQKALAERLLNMTSSSDDLERFVIGRLKLLYGQMFTCNLETMLFDMVNGKEQNDKYQLFVSKEKSIAHMENSRVSDFSVQVLTSGHWPTYQKFERLILPLTVQNALNMFMTYFMKNNDGKKLTWIHELGQVLISAKWPKAPKPYSIQMAPLQAVVLMLFATEKVDSSMSFQDIMKSTNLEEEVVRRVLDSLCFAKFKLLQRARPLSEGRTCKIEDTFSVNLGFSSPMLRFKMIMPTLTVVKSNQNIEKEREHVIEACIVRIMKARKTLTHTELLSEVLTQLQLFRPDPAFIRKRIESLIERDFLERDSENRSVYKYLA